MSLNKWEIRSLTSEALYNKELALKLGTMSETAIKLASVIECIVNNASPVKLQANLHPLQFGIETANVISQFPVS